MNVLDISYTIVPIDHKNHNTMDNRKCNLRYGNASNNAMNRKLRDDNTSGITGVSFDSTKGLWLAQICVNRNNILLGEFVDKEKAIKIRKEAEEKYFGEWSYDNSMAI